MIADLLEFGEGRENDALAPDAIGGLERARGLFDDTLIERGLLRCQVAEHLHLHFCREILYDGNVGFEAPQDERRRQLLQLQRGPGISPFLNGSRNRRLNSVWLPRKPGFRKSMRNNGRRPWFWPVLPVRPSLKWAAGYAVARDWRGSGFLLFGARCGSI